MTGLFLIAARNLGRNWFRTILTVLGAAVALIAFVMLRTVLSSWEVGAEYAAKDRLGTRHKVSFVMQLPKRYIDDIRAVPGVKEATWANWFGGKDPGKPNEFFATIAVDSASFLPVMDELLLDDEAKTRWLGDKRGAIVGDVLAKKLNLKVGDKYTLQGSIYPGDWEFQIDGIYTAGRKSLDRSQFIFHWSYMNDSLPEARRDTIGWVMTRVDDPSKSADISARIDRIFDERDTQTVTMSERNMQLSFMAMFGAILTVLDIVSIIILLIMLMILGNTIAMGVRERTREYAVLRAIGFQPWHIRFFVLGEAVVLGIVAGAVGVGIAYPFVNGVMGKAIEENMSAWFPYFRVEPGVAAAAALIAVVLATTAALVPAIQAGRISVTDALRRVG
jgi:putative ABC transport system permease protein